MSTTKGTALAFLLSCSALPAGAASILYGSDILVDELISIDGTTGAGTSIGSLSASLNMHGLAYDSSTDTLYGTDSGTDALYTINRITGVATEVGSLGFPQVNGLAYDSSTDTLYGSDINTGELVTIDPSTGAASSVGPIGIASAQVNGLAYDSSTETLYGTDIVLDNLISINRSTGAGAAIGPLGAFGIVSGLAYDSSTDTLYGTDTGTGELVTIDRSTGAATSVGSTGFDNLRGLAVVVSEPGSIIMTPDPVGDWICLAGHCGASDSTRTVRVSLLAGDFGPPATLEFRTSVVGGGPFANSTVSFTFDLDVDVTSVSLSGSSGNFSAGPFATLAGANARTEFNCLEAPCEADMMLELAAEPTSGTITDAVNQFLDSPDAPNQALPMTFETVFTFDDVPPGFWSFFFIETLAASGITSGCGPSIYCPNDAMTRAQMAVFLERGMRGSGFSPPAATGNTFLDVGASDFAAAFIEQLFLDGITSGCGGNNYCPNDPVTRAQMAVFLLRAKFGAGHVPPPATGVFDDIPLSHFAIAWIEQLAAEGITSGCGGGNYCPDDPVTRAQMAVFLVRTFEL